MFNNKHKYVLESPLGIREVLYDPMGTNETETENKRSEKTWGITVKIINNLQFIDGDRDWLIQNKQLYGANANVRLTVYSKNPYNDEYELDYTGFLDFTSVTEEKNTVSIDFIEGGLRETFTSLKKEKVELDRITDINDNPIPALNTDTLELKGREIFLTSKLDSADTTQFEIYSGEWNSGNDYRYAFQAFPMDVAYSSDDNISAPLDNISSDNGMSNKPINMFYIIADRDRAEIKLNFDCTFTIANADLVNSVRDQEMKIVLRKYTGGDAYVWDEADDVILRDYFDPFAIGTYQEPITVGLSNHIIQPLQGESYSLGIYFRAKYGQSEFQKGSVTLEINEYSGVLHFEEDSYYPTSTAKCLTMFDVGQRLSEIYTGKPCFRSELLSSGEWKHLLATCGGWLRNLKKETEDDGVKEWSMTYSFDDFFKDIYAIIPCAYSIETEGSQQYIKLEKIQDYFVPRVKINLGKPSDYKKETASELIYHSMEFGYTKGGNYEKPLGLDEPNVRTSWVTPIRKQVSDYDAVAKGRADAYGVEQARRLQAVYIDGQNTGNANEDSPFDKDNFIIDGFQLSPRTGRFPGLYRPRLWQDDFAAAPKNVYSPDTLFNARITPANNRNRHAIWFKAGIQLDAVDSGKLIYTSSEGNSELITQFIGKPPVKESEPSTDIDSLPNRILEADYITCKVPYSYELAQQFKGYSMINGKEVPHIYCLVELINHRNEKETGFLLSEKHKNNQPFQIKLIKAYGV